MDFPAEGVPRLDFAKALRNPNVSRILGIFVRELEELIRLLGSCIGAGLFNPERSYEATKCSSHGPFKGGFPSPEATHKVRGDADYQRAITTYRFLVPRLPVTVSELAVAGIDSKAPRNTMRPFFPREHGRTCGLCFIPTCSMTHRAESLACAGETEIASAITSKVVTARRSRILAQI
jgi:hypothetical protein